MNKQSGATAKLVGWIPQPEPEQGEETQAYRDLIVEAVDLLFRINKAMYAKMGFPPQPVSLKEIFNAVQNKITALKRVGAWRFHAYHTKRYVDRRTNEGSSDKFYLDGKSKILSTSAGYYIPNWAREEMEGHRKKKVQK